MNLLFGHDETVAAWVGRQVGLSFMPPYTAFGLLDREGTLAGGFVFNGYNGNSVEVSLAGRGVVNRGAWQAVLSYVFDQLGCVRMQAHVCRKNRIARKMIRKVGFDFEGVAKKFYGKDDGLCFAITKDEVPRLCRRWKLKV